MKLRNLNLRMFDGDGGAAGAAGAAAPEAAGASEKAPESAKGAAAPEQEAKDRKAAYEAFKAEYKEEYGRDVERAIGRRYAENQQLHRTLASHEALIETLANKYGVTSGENGYSVDDIMAALEKDNSFFEEMAMREGMPVEKYKEYARMQRENRQLMEAQRRAEALQQREQIFAKWDAESEACKARFPEFDFQTEAQNEDFLRLISNGVTVENAYMVCNHDRITKDLMTQTEKDTKKRMADTIRAGGARPGEAAAGAPAAGKEVRDISGMSRQEFFELKKKVLAGEITL